MRGDKIPDLLRILSSANIHEIDILGGEPTLYPYLFDIIDIAQKDNIQVFLSTNGTNISILEKLSERYPDKERFSLGISINSEEISTELLNFILKYEPILKGVVSTKRTIPKAVESIIQEQDLSKYNLLFLDAVALSDLDNCLSFPDYMSILSDLKKRFNNVDGVYCSGFIPNGNEIDILEKIRCPAGTTKLTIMPDGSVYPCYLFVRNKQFRLGNIFEDNFKKIWESPILDFFRNFKGNKCTLKRCEFFDRCHGGCPAVSMLIFNSLEVGDPRCIKPNIHKLSACKGA